LENLQCSEVKAPLLQPKITLDEYNKQSQEVVYLKRLTDEGTAVMLSAELKERLALASLKDELFDK
jgi:hypothetical protein